jgi:hypothetical protein
MPRPGWLELLSPLPDHIVPARKPVASAEQLAQGTAGPIAGWQSVSVNLSDDAGSRHVLVTIDETGQVLSAGDHVMLVRTELRGRDTITIYDHHSVGGRFENDGSFRGTRWHTVTEQVNDAEDATEISSQSATPSAEDVAALRRIVDDVMARAPVSDLSTLLRSMTPRLHDDTYYFVVAPPGFDVASVKPMATIVEDEGVTLIVREGRAVAHRLQPVFRCARITLTVHSDLAAVGLTAAFAKALADEGISCNVIAGVHHDHLFVPVDRAADAMRALERLQAGSQRM